MEYNTKRTKMIIIEYGRHIHTMIWQAIEMKDKKKRNRFVYKIINIMEALNQKIKDIPNFHQKLWYQLFVMSGFKLDVDLPFSTTNIETFKVPLRNLAYPVYLRDYRYYGKIIREMLRVASVCKDLKKKEVLILAIANIMKKKFIKWNKKTIEDSVVFNDIKKLSKGKIILNPLVSL